MMIKCSLQLLQYLSGEITRTYDSLFNYDKHPTKWEAIWANAYYLEEHNYSGRWLAFMSLVEASKAIYFARKQLPAQYRLWPPLLSYWSLDFSPLMDLLKDLLK